MGAVAAIDPGLEDVGNRLVEALCADLDLAGLVSVEDGRQGPLGGASRRGGGPASCCLEFPRLKRGELPTPVRLGYKLRSLRGRVFDGAAIR